MTIAVLSWKAHNTLINTLESYRRHKLDELDTERFIFFQEIDSTDIQIAKDYGYGFEGSKQNIGIAGGYKEMVNLASGDLFLFLENDWQLIERPHGQLRTAAELLRHKIIDVARLRHRSNPGIPLWTRQFEGIELSRPEHLLDAIHWTDISRFEQITEIDNGWFATEARYANWTNNPTMFRREWLLETIVPRMEGDVERHLQDWWQQRDFVVAQSEGLFTHKRVDH